MNALPCAAVLPVAALSVETSFPERVVRAEPEA